MIKVTRIEDIDRDRENRERNKMKKNISDDIVDVFEESANRIDDFFKRKGIEKELADSKRNKGKKYLWAFLGLVGFGGLILLIVNFLLVNIWLLQLLIRLLIKSLLG